LVENALIHLNVVFSSFFDAKPGVMGQVTNIAAGLPG